MTAEEKKAMRAEMDKKKKAAKKKRAEEERKRRLAEAAEQARIAALEFLEARAKDWTPWTTVTHFAVDLRGFVSVDGARAAPEHAESHALQEADEAWDPDHDEEQLLQGVVGGEFMCCQRQSFPVLSRISGYSEVRSKQKVCPGQKAVFKIKVVEKGSGAWSVGIVRNTVTAGLAWSTSCLKNQVFYLNTAKSNLFNGPLLQYFNSEGTDGPYATDDNFGRTGSTDATTDKGSYFGPNGWMPPINYEFNNHGRFYQIQQDDTIEMEVDLESKDGELRFLINGRQMPNSIKGIRTALQAAPETTEGQTEDAQDGDAGTPRHENDANAGTGTGQADSIVEKADNAAADGDTDEVGYQLAVQVHSAGDVVRLYAPPRPDEDAAAEDKVEGAQGPAGGYTTVTESKDKSQANDALGQDEGKKRSRKSKSPSKKVAGKGSKATRKPTESPEASRGKAGTHADKDNSSTAMVRRGR